MKLSWEFKSWPSPPLHHCQEVGEAALCPGCRIQGAASSMLVSPSPSASPPPLLAPHIDGTPCPASSGSPSGLERPGCRPHIHLAATWLFSVHHRSACGHFRAQPCPHWYPGLSSLKYLNILHVLSHFWISAWAAPCLPPHLPTWNECLLSIVC